MPDLSPSLLPRLTAHRLADLDLGREAVHPNYGGLSLLNLPSTLFRWFGAPDLPHPPLDLPELDDLASNARQIIVCLIDALSFSRLLLWLEGPGRSLRPYVDSGLLAVLTSVVPSTTTAALTTLWTGRSPAEHGIVGYELLLREYGLVTNMISLGPAAFDAQRGLLERSGVRPESLLPAPTLGPRLIEAGVAVDVFLSNALRGSGLSRMHYPGTDIHGFGSPADLWHSVREHIEARPADKNLIWVYYGALDALSHVYGPDSPKVQVEFEFFTRALAEVLVRGLHAHAGRGTVLLLLSDHGQLATPLDPRFQLHDHPSLTRRLALGPTGEPRLPYLYVRPGQAAAVEEYVARTWPGSFSLLSSEHALAAGLFGPGKAAEATPSRLGDRVVLCHGQAYLWWSDKEDLLLGRHGGLTADEMLVPLLAFRLD